jgi:UDP-N-acetylglucosamine--N-acetylmuramyl-(pentapeptide) pyrophosphoryl-undecaprenol N-acetylglucosamine transferase
MSEKIKIIISGGGTGGHIFPAIAIADAIKKIFPNSEILFIGAKGKMEMEKVPLAGYPIKALWISGFQRRLTWKNLLFPIKVVYSLGQAMNIIHQFKPDLVIGVGGFASGPTLRMAARKKIPTLIQEQNSFPGITNRILGSKVDRICVAYSGMEMFFPKERIVMTGNPVRNDLSALVDKKEEAIRFFGLKNDKLTVFIMGGSLGARTINSSVLNCIRQNITESGVQLLWQTGKFYFRDINTEVSIINNPDIHIYEFINRMNLAFSAADIIVSRAGAIAISELCIVGKPVILIPSPNVTDDHQTKNAQALSMENAAILLKNSEAEGGLFKTITDLIANRPLQKSLSENIRKMAVTDASVQIANEALKLITNHKKES